MKFISLILALIMILSFSACQGSVSSSVSENEIPEAIEVEKKSVLVDSLYNFKKTDIKNSEDVKKILDTVPYFINIKNNVSVSGNNIIIKYTIKNLTKYRSKNLLKMELMQVAVTVFALIPSCSHIQFAVKDVYDSVYEFSCSRDNISSKYGMGYFKEEVINKATSRKKVFEEFMVHVLDIEYDKGDVSLKSEEINKKIGDLCEAEEEPHYKTSFNYEEKKQIPGIKIDEYAYINGINLKDYYGKKLSIEFYDVKNFETKEVTPYMFIFYKNKIVGYSDLKGKINESDVINHLQ